MLRCALLLRRLPAAQRQQRQWPRMGMPWPAAAVPALLVVMVVLLQLLAAVGPPQ
jgi:hypothetical protein